MGICEVIVILGKTSPSLIHFRAVTSITSIIFLLLKNKQHIVKVEVGKFFGEQFGSYLLKFTALITLTQHSYGFSLKQYFNTQEKVHTGCSLVTLTMGAKQSDQCECPPTGSQQTNDSASPQCCSGSADGKPQTERYWRKFKDSNFIPLWSACEQGLKASQGKIKHPETSSGKKLFLIFGLKGQEERRVSSLQANKSWLGRERQGCPASAVVGGAWLLLGLWQGA